MATPSHLEETAPTVGLLLHKTDSDPQKLPALTHFRRLRLIFRAESVAFSLLFRPRSLKKARQRLRSSHCLCREEKWKPQ